MDYRILIPATHSIIPLKEKFDAVEDISKIIVVNNYKDEEIYNFCKEVEKQGVKTYYYPQNYGLSASWNIGLKELKKNVDLVIIISQFIKIKTSLMDFISAIEENEIKKPKGFYLATENLGFHCFGVTKLGLKLGGYFDENFYPIYYEDTDYKYRWKFNGLYEMLSDLHLDIASIVELSFSMKRNKEFQDLWLKNCDFTYNYYKRKWGGLHHKEIYSHPFNNDVLDINYWKPKDREQITF